MLCYSWYRQLLQRLRPINALTAAELLIWAWNGVGDLNMMLQIIGNKTIAVLGTCNIDCLSKSSVKWQSNLKGIHWTELISELIRFRCLLRTKSNTAQLGWLGAYKQMWKWKMRLPYVLKGFFLHTVLARHCRHGPLRDCGSYYCGYNFCNTVKSIFTTEFSFTGY